MDKYDVTLYVYDITNGKKINDLGMAKQFSPMFIGKTIEGVYHTSLVVYGVEYFFGGGICRGYPKVINYNLSQHLTDSLSKKVCSVLLKFLKKCLKNTLMKLTLSLASKPIT